LHGPKPGVAVFFITKHPLPALPTGPLNTEWAFPPLVDGLGESW
jgi:hypothetical protein